MYLAKLGWQVTGVDAVDDALAAFKRGRRMVLPRGMDKEEITGLFGDAWELVDVVDIEPLAESMPPPIRRARPRGTGSAGRTTPQGRRAHSDPGAPSCDVSSRRSHGRGARPPCTVEGELTSQPPAASMFFVTTSIVRWSSSVGLNSTISVPAKSTGVWPGAA